MDRDRSGHDGGQAWVPAAGEIEEADHVARVGHPGHDQADAEQNARGKRCQLAAVHGVGLAMNSRAAIATGAAPVAMNVGVATREGIERGEMPHTPWQEVQPPPIRVPNPTRTPAARSTGVEVEGPAAGDET